MKKSDIDEKSRDEKQRRTDSMRKCTHFRENESRKLVCPTKLSLSGCLCARREWVHVGATGSKELKKQKELGEGAQKISMRGLKKIPLTIRDGKH